MLLVKITHDGARVVAYNEDTSTMALEDALDALGEAREVILARSTSYQQSMKNYHSRRLHP